MQIKSYLNLLGGAVLCVALSYSLTALAQQPPERPQISKEKMEAIRACASAKGVDMPAPPPGDHKGPPPEEGRGEHKKPPKMTDAQKAVIDECFKANGVEPPKGPPGPPPGEEPKAE